MLIKHTIDMNTGELLDKEIINDKDEADLKSLVDFYVLELRKNNAKRGALEDLINL